MRRNEVGSKCSVGKVLYVDEDKQRQQRAGLFLRDVQYRLHARLELTEAAGWRESITKSTEMFQRRAEKGQCFNQPYLGCREFACSFELHSPLPFGAHGRQTFLRSRSATCYLAARTRSAQKIPGPFAISVTCSAQSPSAQSSFSSPATHCRFLDFRAQRSLRYSQRTTLM